MSVPSAPGTEVSILESSTALPEHLRQYTTEEGSDGLISGGDGFPKVSIRGKQFRFITDGQETTFPLGQAFAAVILAADPPDGFAKSYYKGAYVPDSNEAPTCSSSNGKTPDGFVMAPISQSCATCPFNAFESGTDEFGKPTKGKACSDVKNLYVVPEDVLEGEIAVLRVPAKSFKSLNKLGRQLKSQDLPMNSVVVNMSFADETHPQLIFTASRFLDAAEMEISVRRSSDKKFLNLLPSKNTTAPVQQGPQLVATDKCGSSSLEDYKKNGWTDQQLVEGGFAEYAKALAPPEPAIPAAPNDIPDTPAAPKEPQKVLTEKAGTNTYDSFIENNWTDEQLIQHGYMTLEE